MIVIAGGINDRIDDSNSSMRSRIDDVNTRIDDVNTRIEGVSTEIRNEIRELRALVIDAIKANQAASE